jgi:hypothetical protein
MGVLSDRIAPRGFVMNTGYASICVDTLKHMISRSGENLVWGSLDRLYYVRTAEIASQEASILAGHDHGEGTEDRAPCLASL